MSTTSQTQALLARTLAQHHRSPGADTGTRTRSHPRDGGLIPVMGPANHAPGLPIMGASSRSVRTAVMGGPDPGRRMSVMGSGDPPLRLDLFGDSDLSIVDSLFGGQSNAR